MSIARTRIPGEHPSVPGSLTKNMEMEINQKMRDPSPRGFFRPISEEKFREKGDLDFHALLEFWDKDSQFDG